MDDCHPPERAVLSAARPGMRTTRTLTDDCHPGAGRNPGTANSAARARGLLTLSATAVGRPAAATL